METLAHVYSARLQRTVADLREREKSLNTFRLDSSALVFCIMLY